MKKKMYYNMRIKTMQRTFSTIGKLIKKGRKIKLDSLNEDIANLQLRLFQMNEKDHGEKYEDEDQKKSIKLEKDTCKEMYSDKMDEIEHVDEIYYSVKKKLYENSKLSIHKLITELETGGNIRLEEGKSNEKWYVSCVDLIRSRFHNEDMSLMGI